MYSMLPIDYFSRIDYGYIDREEIQQMIRDALNLYLYQYGSDYVELEQKDIGDDQDLSVSSELDLILLDMDDDDENDDNPFGEELDDDYDEIELDEYEYEDLIQNYLKILPCWSNGLKDEILKTMMINDKRSLLCLRN